MSIFSEYVRQRQLLVGETQRTAKFGTQQTRSVEVIERVCLWRQEYPLFFFFKYAPISLPVRGLLENCYFCIYLSYLYILCFFKFLFNLFRCLQLPTILYSVYKKKLMLTKSLITDICYTDDVTSISAEFKKLKLINEELEKGYSIWSMNIVVGETIFCNLRGLLSGLVPPQIQLKFYKHVNKWNMTTTNIKKQRI